MNDTSHKEAYIRDALIPELVRRAILTFTEDAPAPGGGATLKSVVVKPLVTNGFMLTIPFKVTVVLEEATDGATNGVASTDNRTANGDESHHRTETLHLVVKITPDCNEEMYRSCQFETLFENEMIAYTEIIPTLGKAELYPRYYHCERKPSEAVMVMSDFSFSGWKMAPMVVNLPLDYILLAVKELGRFHGECYGMKEVRPEQFERIRRKFKESRYAVDVTDETWLTIMSVAPKRAIKAVRESRFGPLVPDEYLAKLGRLFEDPWEHAKRKVLPREPMAIICHGDYLRNNMAFRYDDAQDHPTKPTQVMMFDFQTLRYASPMIDYAAFLANSTGYGVREQHFEAIFEQYHRALVQTVARIVGVADVTELAPHFSYESFHRELAEYYSYGFNIASSFLMILYEPMEISFTETLMTRDEAETDAWQRGGEPLNQELAAMIYEMYQLHSRYGLDPL
uniref:Putative juvenile hormone-inducible protein n=1 Tax=Anopheles triannulatus TaxID=58253 RepID=A0A2M4AF53_9DIPT